MKKIYLLILLLCALMLLSPLTAFAEEFTQNGNGLAITEVCFNPKWKEGDPEIAEGADVFPFIEICNSYGMHYGISQLGGVTLQYGDLSSDELICAGDDPKLEAGEIAVIVLYSEYWSRLGLDNTAESIDAVYETFVELHGIADIVDKNHFYVASNKDFALSLEGERETLQLWKDGVKIRSAVYDATFYNRSNRSVVFDTDGHCMGVTVPTPGTIFDNQNNTVSLFNHDMQTIPIKAVEYNICASGIPNDYEDIPFIADRQDEAFALIETEAPDLIVLCEVNFAWQEYIQAFCEKNGYTAYGFSSTGRDFHGNLGKQKWDLTSLILWKSDRFEAIETNHFWCSATPDKKNSNKWGGGIVGDMARCINYALLKDKASGVEFLFLGAHLDAKSEEVRALSTQLIYDKSHEIAGERPIIMLGDWNANQTHESYHILTSGDLADARFRTFVSDLHGTFNKWGEYSADIQTRLPIDHCIITKDKIWVDYYKQVGGPAVENVPHPSDHNMTVFSLQVSTGEPLPQTTEAETTEPTQSEGGCKAIAGAGIVLLAIGFATMFIPKRKY